MIEIGILALQGSIHEHCQMLQKIDGVKPRLVKTVSDLNMVSGLILPGGESTTIGKLLTDFKLTGSIIKRAQEGMPVWGTCAGMILLASEVIGETYVYLGLMNISVRRNAYGGQLDSFNLTMNIPQVAKEEIPLVFVRAPWVEKSGRDVQVLATLNTRRIAVQQNNLLATSFHPELTTSTAFHMYFTNMVKKYISR